MVFSKEINDPAVIRWAMERPTTLENGQSRPIRIAVVGLTNKPGRPALGVSRFMKQQGYRIIPVNPRAESVLDEQAYPSLVALPEPVDIVQVFRRPEFIPEVVADLKQMAVKPKLLWLQEGITHDQAAQEAMDWGVAVVQDRCTYKEVVRIQHGR